MDNDFQIPGLDWDNLTIQQTKFIQNFICQELARYKSKDNYLARLQNFKLLPMLTSTLFNKHNPCDKIEMLKIEWNNQDISQQNGHYVLTKNQNYTQNLRVVAKCIQYIPILANITVLGKDHTTIDTGKGL